MSAGPVYRRSKDGITIHREGCRYFQAGVVWHYANGWSEARVRNTIGDYPWLRLCKRCWA